MQEEPPQPGSPRGIPFSGGTGNCLTKKFLPSPASGQLWAKLHIPGQNSEARHRLTLYLLAGSHLCSWETEARGEGSAQSGLWFPPEEPSEPSRSRAPRTWAWAPLPYAPGTYRYSLQPLRGGCREAETTKPLIFSPRGSEVNCFWTGSLEGPASQIWGARCERRQKNPEPLKEPRAQREGRGSRMALRGPALGILSPEHQDGGYEGVE